MTTTIKRSVSLATLIILLSLTCKASAESNQNTENDDENKIHMILGAGSFGIPYKGDGLIVKSSIFVDKLKIRIFKRREDSCDGDYHDYVELDGPVTKDAIYVLEKILIKLERCQPAIKEEERKKTIIYMNSPGGLYDVGIKIGHLFRKYDVETRLSGDQFCASSCAIMFLGGTIRSITSKNYLAFHSPYINLPNNQIYCFNRDLSGRLNAYYKQMIGSDAGARLFDRTMMYCSESDAWIINADAAALYSITSKEKMLISSNSSWREQVSELQMLIKNKALTPRIATISALNPDEYWHASDLEDGQAHLDDETVAAMEKNNLFWYTKKIFYVRFYNPSKINIKSVDLRFNEGHCKNADAANSIILRFDIGKYPLMPKVGAVYYFKMQNAPEAMKTSAESCGVVIAARGNQ